MRRRLFNHGRSYQVDPVRGRMVVRPLRAWFLVTAIGCAGTAMAPWLVTHVGPLQLTVGDWMLVLAYAVAALGLGGIGLAPANRTLQIDVPAGEITVGARYGLGPSKRVPIGELRFGYRERLLPIGDVVACRATVAHASFGELTIVETSRDHKRLPKHIANALEQARRDRDPTQLEAVAHELAQAGGLEWGGVAIMVGLLCMGPLWLWWYLG